MLRRIRGNRKNAKVCSWLRKSMHHGTKSSGDSNHFGKGCERAGRGLQPDFDARAGIEKVTHSVADKIEREHGQHYGQSREEHEMWGVEQVGPAIVEHGSPTGCRRGYAQTEKAHRGFGQDRTRHADCGLHNHGLNNVRKNMAGDHAQIACAQGSGGFDKLAFAGGQNLGAHQAGIAHPSSNGKREHEVENARAAEGDKSDGQKNSGERQKRVHHYDVEEAIDVSAIVAGDRSHDQAERKRDRDHRTSHQHGNARAVDEAGENVSPQFIGAAPVRGRRRRQACGQIDVRWILRRDPGSEQCEDHKDHDQHRACGRQRVVAGGAGQRDGEGGQDEKALIAKKIQSNPLVYSTRVPACAVALYFLWYSHTGMSKKNMASSIDDFLKKENIFEEAQAQAIKEVVAWQLAKAMKKKKISKARMAVLLKTSRSQVDRILDPKRDITLSSLQQAAALVGQRVVIELV